MENFEFKSQVATTKEQSERLLKLGLKKESADMVHYKSSSMKEWGVLATPFTKECEACKSYYPAWSLHRLMEIYRDNYNYIRFQNAYNELIHAISISIEDETFNKDYLEEKK